MPATVTSWLGAAVGGAAIEERHADSRTTAHSPKPSTPSSSPSMPRMWLGSSFSDLEHRQEVPLGPDARRHRRERRRPWCPAPTARTARARRAPPAPRTTTSRRAARSCGKNGICGSFSPAFSRFSTLGGTLMPWRWMNSRCDAQQHRRDRRQDRDVDAVEARQRGAGHVVAAAQEAHHEVARPPAPRRRCRCRPWWRRTPARSTAAGSR